MKISYNWLKEHLDLALPVEDLAAHLLKLGFEIAGVQHLGAAFAGVVAAKVVSREKHPNADKLSVCVVDDGTQQWSVVCGAPNVAAGQTIALARIGAVLPGGFNISKVKLRGVESHGMICSRAELGMPMQTDGIWVLDEGPALGTDIASLLGPADDVMEVEVTSNRPDCLSHRGLARELAAYFRKPLKPLSHEIVESSLAPLPVEVEDVVACPFYGGRLIEGVKIGKSPAWLKNRLESIGLRPINNVADITNFVLHDNGHPLHAFDADKLSGDKIVVRRSRKGEKLLALDHKTYDLPEGLLVIADAEKPVALAGVMGGEDSSVTERTTRVVLEGAYFAPPEVRSASQKTHLRSDSSYRFERGADPEAARPAAARAAALILQLAGGRAAKAAEKSSPREPNPLVQTTVSRLNAVLGAAFAAGDVQGALRAIAPDLKAAGDELELRAPSWRRDLSTANDLAEEVGRLLGYDNIPYRMAPLSPLAASTTPIERESRRVRLHLSALGLWEAYNYDLLAQKALAACRLSSTDLPRVAHPLSEDWEVLRPSLLPGLLKNAQHNLSRGADAVRLFELGKTYARQGNSVTERWRTAGIILGPMMDARWQPARAPRAGFADAKAAVEDLLSRAGATTWARLDEPSAGKTPSDPLFHPANSLRAVVLGVPAATVGWLHPRAARAHDLEDEGAIVFDADLEWLSGLKAPSARFYGFSPFPVSRRDLAIVLDKSTPYASVESTIRSCKAPELQDILLFDVYEGKGVPDGSKSLAVRLTFGRTDRTLTDAEVSAAVENVLAALARELGAKLRS